jgi:hypothetical protein
MSRGRRGWGLPLGESFIRVRIVSGRRGMVPRQELGKQAESYVLALISGETGAA